MTQENANTHEIVTQTLNPLTLDFNGASLIEASAGTGKTYTISGLYLRLLLGHGSKGQSQTPLTCEQILVVTFTNAATEELRDRIRKRVATAYKCFMGLTVNDSFVQALFDEIDESQRMSALRRLDLALKSLDEAAIFTIHGFCQRMLSDMAFESCLLFESEFTLDDSEYLHHAVRDFWRSACYSLPGYLARIIANKFSDPDTLSQQLRPLLGASQARVVKPPANFNQLAEKLGQSLSRLKLIWPRERDATETLLHSLPLNGVRFGKKAEQFPKLAAMIDAMDNWACSPNLTLPDLKVLDALALSGLKLNKGGEIPSPQEAPLLDHIERLLELINQFVPAFLYSAREGIANRFYAQKQADNTLSPDDLLTQLSQALTPDTRDANELNHQDDPSAALAKAIATRFPVALIDEFQDTDPLQFAIFNQIYGLQDQTGSDKQSTSLLMIGDPKQAIYAFRGADIYTYIDAREQTPNHYNLDTNYRSSERMIQGVNQIFSQHADPFINQSIPFEVVKAPSGASNKQLIDGSSHNDTSALRIRLLAEDPEKGLNKNDARAQLSDDAANQIARLLTEASENQAQLDNKILKAKDIAVLVRDRNEAAYIQQALRKRGIGSVFLSRDSVLDTQEAREMALILKALANPRDELAIRSALATGLIGYQASRIQTFNQDENQRQQILEQFFELNQIWLKRGIMPALLALANETQLIARLLNSSKVESDQQDSLNAFIGNRSSGERRLTDFRHLSELLQQESTRLDGINALVNWYEQSLIQSRQGEASQLRLESEQNLVQIVTIHKSKGLEYPICLLPFISLARDSRRKPSPMLYHKDAAESDNALIWDLEQSDEGWEQYKQEVLAEDLRLLYVALTRPVHRCYLYIANHSRFTKKSGISSQLCDTGIGHLLAITDKDCDFDKLQAKANAISSEAISVTEITREQPQISLPADDKTQLELSPKALKLSRQTPWRVASYSGLVKNLGHEKAPASAELVGVEDESLDLLDTSAIPSTDDLTLNRFTFERGANAGSFMHLVLELIDFRNAKAALEEHLPQAMEKYAIDEHWQAVLHHWYLDLLEAPLKASTSNDQVPLLCLASLANESKLVEMEFYLPLAKLKANELNQLLAQYGYSHDLNFDELQGMLKGFIDLCFEYQGQYYIADYKSNYLGDSYESYNQNELSQAITGHRYDLQYLLYTLALHRFLQQRIANYDYQHHIGGCYYLFLRGMSAANHLAYPNSGVFFDKPDYQLIQALDALFAPNQEPHHQSENTPNNRLDDNEQLELLL